MIWVLAPFLDTDDPNLAYYSDYEQSYLEYKKAFESLTHFFKQLNEYLY